MKKFARLFASLAVLVNSTSVSTACSSYLGPEGYRIGLFLPYTYYKPWLGMFQYELYASEVPGMSQASEHDRDINCSEWLARCGRGVKKADIYFVMYQVPPGYFLEMLEKPIDPHKTEAGNTFVQWLIKKGHAPELRYMRFAKYCESLSMQRIDPWDEDILDFDRSWGKYYAEGYEEMLACKDAFLRQRWAFQFNRMHAYGAAEEDKIRQAAVLSQEGSQPSSLVQGWNAAYLSLNNTYSVAQRNVFLVRAFDLTQDKKYFAVRYFNAGALGSTIALLGNNAHLKAVAYGMAALAQQHICPDLLAKIAAEDPSGEILELVLAREIQKTEDMLMTEKITGFFPASADIRLSIYDVNGHYSGYYDAGRLVSSVNANNASRARFESYARMLLETTETLLAAGVKKRAFLELAAAHLGWCLGDAQVMLRHLDGAGKYMAKNDPLYVNLLAGKMLAAMLAQKSFENTALEIYRYLDANTGGHDVQNLRDQLSMALVAHYEKNGQLHKAALVLPQAVGLYKAIDVQGYGIGDYTHSPVRYFAANARTEDADNMMALLAAPRKTPFEAYITRDFAPDSLNYDLVMEWVGSVYLRNEKWDKALAAFEKVSRGYWNLDFGKDMWTVRYRGHDIDRWNYYPLYLDSNPFAAKVAFNHSRSKADTVRYNKLTFTRQFIALQKAAASPDTRIRDQALLQMAHARYNMTWYGNSWILYRNEWSAYENKHWPAHGQDYFACAAAARAYLDLYNRTADPEIKASCCIMLAVCDRNKSYYDHRNDSRFAYRGSSYLDLFMNDYKNTRTYERLMTSCAGEDEFISGVNRDEKL